MSRVILQIDLDGDEQRLERLQEEIQELVVKHGFNDGLVVAYPLEGTGSRVVAEVRKEVNDG